MAVMIMLFSFLVGLISAAPANNECGCFPLKISGEFDMKTTSILARRLPEIKQFRINGFFDLDLPNKRLHTNVWNADFETGINTTFAFDSYIKLLKNHLQIIPGGNRKCLNGLLSPSLFKVLDDYFEHGIKNRCLHRDMSKNTTTNGVITYHTFILGDMAFDAQTCQLKTITAKNFFMGVVDLTLKVDTVAGTHPIPGVCPNPAIDMSKSSAEDISKIADLMAPLNELSKLKP
ncbi:uncharacterized protein LOC141909858 [Tubulanus polymorphus]|uniref:uncharacterized protein LOC141909858 n=1 Tax=Tubulanus polymorphus TaxID=672921 RepID=UPI003DA480F4